MDEDPITDVRLEGAQDDHSEIHLEREDERFTQKGRLSDWLTLLLMIAAYLVWTGVVYLFEPGIR